MALGDPYVTAAKLADYLKVTVADQETQLAAAAIAASRWLEGYCGRQFNLDASATPRVFDVGQVTGLVLTDDIGDETITVVTDSALDGTFATTWVGGDFQAMPQGAIAQGRPVTFLAACGDLRFPWSDRRAGLVKVTAKWGWPAVPEDVTVAALIQASRLYKRRDSAEGVLGFGDFGPVRVGARVDPDVEMLLAPYRLVPLG
jgi:hypothetical protein